ncbi:hypothetical protein FGB62_4g271 [Gracilaria domingensis]|nr:hypothetical protein FGB62_4g271 [Gracilaria domingensis]
MHLHPQPFTQVSHAFPASYISPHPSQHHTTPADNPFNFQTTTNDPTLQPHAHVADAQRSYLNDLPPRDQHQYGRYPSPRLRQSNQHTDASTAITAITQTIPPAVNGAHPSLPNSSTQSNPPPTPVRIPSSINRDTTGNRFSQTQPSTQTLTPPLQSQVPSAARDSNLDNSQARNPNETAEERKRRLARERQRRRRKRLKLDPQTNPNKPHVDTSSRVEEPHREAGASSQNVPVDINMHVRPAADNPVQMPSSAIQPTLHTSFEASNLGSNNHSTLQPLQVAPVTATQEEIHVSSAAGRHAYNSHSLNVGSGPNASNGLSSSHRAAADLARMSGASDERIMRPNDPEEDPESRKRRLARDRQRRRRQRLKEKKIEEADKAQGQQSQALKYEPTQTRIVDSVEVTRPHTDLDRRTIPSDPITDSVRMPLATPPANVFGPRSDVTANIPFDQQSRLVRNAATPGMPESTVPPMTLSFNGNNGINLGAMPVSNVMGSLNLVHWSQGFESESAARFAVDAAVGAFRAHLGANNPNAKAYVLQQGILMLSVEEGGRELINGQILASLRADGVMRFG